MVLTTKAGDVSIVRYDGKLATLSSPGQPDRPVALKRRDLDELLSEELRRLDPDEVYAATARRIVQRSGRTAGRGGRGTKARTAKTRKKAR